MSNGTSQAVNEEYLVEALNVQKTYRMGASTIEVLKGVSVGIRAGETVSIVGASGAGKSTLLHILGGLDEPSRGTVLYRRKSLYDMSSRDRTDIRALRIGVVFQAYHLLPELDILENVMLPAMSRFGALRSLARTRARAGELLKSVGLGERALHRPTELSGGEQQRAALARALMNDPEIVLADEPTGNLDSKTGALVLQYLFDLTKQRGHTLVLVTHNEEVASRCDRKLHLTDGCVEQS